MKIVKFITSWRNYFTGDVAGFELATALFLIGKGIAIEYVENEPQEEPQEVKPKRRRKNETQDINS
jgi:hypothetical protein